MTETPATKTTKRAAKAPAVKATSEPKPARKRSSAKLTIVETPAVETPAVETPAKRLSDEQRAQLVELHQQMTAAVEAFEANVVELLQAGASPSHVGDAVKLGNSSVRRILWRRVPETAPKR